MLAPTRNPARIRAAVRRLLYIEVDPSRPVTFDTLARVFDHGGVPLTGAQIVAIHKIIAAMNVWRAMGRFIKYLDG